jgi:allantoate deiminase
MDAREIEIDSNLLQARIETLGKIGRREDNGLYRLVYTPEWAEAVDLVEGWLQQESLRTWRDAAGNLWGRLEGTEAGPVVATGSHIDTVPRGGAYDGALGVHAGLAAIRALAKTFGQPRRSIDLLVVCDEEGSRFRSDFLGSAAVAGSFAEDLGLLRDADGVSAAEAMRAAGLEPARFGEARRDDIAAWLELHIEQGGTLESEGLDAGVVHTITGHRIVRVTVEGRQDHAGTTPMDVRRDAMAGAAEMIQQAIGVAESLGRPAVCTAGWIEVRPGAANVVPGVVRFTLDMREADPLRLAELSGGVDLALGNVARRRELQVATEDLMFRRPVPLDADLQALLARHAEALGLRWRSMPSMAGHDSEVMAPRWPSGMVFVPSHDGRSHTPEEYTPIEQVLPGVRVLAAALWELAYP